MRRYVGENKALNQIEITFVLEYIEHFKIGGQYRDMKRLNTFRLARNPLVGIMFSFSKRWLELFELCIHILSSYV